MAMKKAKSRTDESGFITRLRDEVAALRMRSHALEQEHTAVKAELLLKQKLLHRGNNETLVDAVREFFRLSVIPATAKEIERWLVIQGHGQGVVKFYQIVYATLRAMPDVAPLIKEGETTRFALKTAPVPTGWRRLEIPSRNTSASRQRQPKISAAEKPQ